MRGDEVQDTSTRVALDGVDGAATAPGGKEPPMGTGAGAE